MPFYRCGGGKLPYIVYKIVTTSTSGSRAKIAFYEGDKLIGEFVHSSFNGTTKEVGPFTVTYSNMNWKVGYQGNHTIHSEDGLSIPTSWSYGTEVNYTFKRYPTLE